MKPVSNVIEKIIFAILIFSFLVFIVSFFISRSISKPVERLRKLASDIGNGQRNIKLGASFKNAPKEIHSLGATIDKMSRSLLKSEQIFEQAKNELKKMAYYDPLTGVATMGKVIL